MGKKKKKEQIEYVPSKYQQAIFEYIQKEQGHLVVEAAAGSGKTYTLVKSLSFIPNDKKILLTAFNTDIVKELTKKTKTLDNVETKTLHGLGLSFLRKNFNDKRLEIDEFKYASHIKNNVKEYTSFNTFKLRGREYYRYLDNIKKYVDFGRLYLCQTLKDLDFIEERYDIETIQDEKEIALKIMEWGKDELDTIDYTDMIWLPNKLFLKPYGLLYDYIMVDECQDLNKAERELILKCFKLGTRMISVGDRNQCIYSFAGSDPDSFDEICKMPNTVRLPLSISYRCSPKIVNYAKSIVPSIEANDDGRKGEILFNVSLDDVQQGDMILCRNNAPLFQVYNTFLKMGKNVYIRGKDIGSNLKSIIKSTRQELLNRDCNEDGVFIRLYDDLFTSRDKLMDKFNIDADMAMSSQHIQNKIDYIKAIEILSEGLKTSDEVIAKIDEIFPRRAKKDGIALSTVHKAKGLEANNVYIVCHSLMPSKSAKKDWEVSQEHNLMYVAYTRAKDKLGFIDEKDFEDFDTSNANTRKSLSLMETKVCKVLNKTKRQEIGIEMAKFIAENAEKIDAILNGPSVDMGSAPNRKVNVLNDLLHLNKKNKK